MAGCGGFVGTALRFLVGRWCGHLHLGEFPLGTFVVNVVGSFVIGILFGYAERTTLITAAMNALLITGFCGGFTTFSSFSHDMLTLIEHRQYLYFGLYAVLSFALGLLMVWLGREVVLRHV
jgi:CrcB protein